MPNNLSTYLGSVQKKIRQRKEIKKSFVVRSILTPWKQTYYDVVMDIKEKNKLAVRKYRKTQKYRETLSKYKNSEVYKNTFRKKAQRYRKLNKTKVFARVKLEYEVKMGRIEKKNCITCSNIITEAHHYLGYEGDHWKDVQWLCRRHHMELHI